ncbi:calcium-binding protein [Novipirellula maiorica]|uniref:calcium-binding protein n=1 Tax=Novipirellula maiorica TaxID=1265734 RepID=UPI001360B3AD|nr:calcium-binding protein [Rhodopirellula maiorica]
MATLLPGPHGIPDFVEDETVSTVASGYWGDASIWSNGQVPGVSDRVLIRSEHDVVFDNGDIDVLAIGVHGELEISASLRVKDFVVYQDGSLSMLSGAEVVFADAANSIDDPLQWGTGLIVQGEWTATGEAKTPYVRAVSDIPAGSTQFTADEIPLGWEVGDILALPETAQSVVTRSGKPLEESETVTIAKIEGKTIHFTSAASFNHNGISPNPFEIERFAHVANLTRSIVLRSENPQGFRGHTVATYQAQVDLDGVAFVGLGRTSADEAVDDTVISDGGDVIHVGANPAGRYPFHTHHLHGSVALTDSVVQDGLKWGITIHKTNNGLIEDNIVYDVDGGGIVTEDGDEFGNQFLGNLVIKVDGGHQVGDGRAGAMQNLPRSISKPTIETGADGSGFWFRGPANVVEGNFVYDAASYGYNYNGYYRQGTTRQVTSFRDNEVASSRGGLWATWSQSCCNADDFKRQVFEDLLVWHVSHHGVIAYHEAEMTLRNTTVIGNPNIASSNQGSEYTYAARTTVAYAFGHQQYENHDLILENIRASGNNIGLMASPNPGNGTILNGAVLQNYINIGLDKSFESPDLTMSNVQFLPTYVQKISGAYPDLPANVWQESVGTLEPGEFASGASGAVGSQPTAIATTVLKLEGGAGDDIVTVAIRGGLIDLDLNGVRSTLPLGNILWIEFSGGAGNDHFTNATHLPSKISGGPGNDTLFGGSGNDTIHGDAGDDFISGGDGDDIIYGDLGNDRLLGDAGVDRVRGGDGDDHIFGGDGSDHTLDGGAGNDHIDGGSGGDRIFGGEGDDVLFGGTGNDRLVGNAGHDVLFGEAGDDILYGDDEKVSSLATGIDRLVGGSGKDRFRPGGSADEVFGSIDDLFFTAADDRVLRLNGANQEIDAFGTEQLIRLLEASFQLDRDEALRRISTM